MVDESCVGEGTGSMEPGNTFISFFSKTIILRVSKCIIMSSSVTDGPGGPR